MTTEKRSRSNRSASRIGVLVLGMHRSGTSALSRVLSLLGCDLPKTLMSPAESNEAGHWESVEIMKLNDQILQSAGSNWHDWLEFNPGWYASPKAAEYKEKALAVLEDEFGRSSLFVLKDPRICRFAPFWIDVFESAGIQPAIVAQIRNPLEVARSLAQRDGFDPALAHLIWLRHVLEAEAGSRGCHRFHTSYEGMLYGWPRLVSEMQGLLDLSWPRLSPMTSGEIGNFLTERLRHHSESSDKVLDNPLLSGWLRDSFAIFSRWARDGESEGDRATLDRIRTELNEAGPAFAQLILSGHQRAKDLKAAQRSIEEQGSQLAESRRALSEAQAALAGSKSELDAITGELSQTQSALAQRSAEADEVTAQLRQAEQRHAEELEAQRNSAAAEIEKLRDEKAAAEARLAELEEHAAELEAQCNGANAEIEKLRHEKGTAEGRLTERFSELAALTRMLKNMESELETRSRQAEQGERAARRSAEEADWLREVSAVMLNGSGRGGGKRSLKRRLSALLLKPMRTRQEARLKESGIFDPDAYLAANPDVAEAGADPLRHYITHGMREGRNIQ